MSANELFVRVTQVLDEFYATPRETIWNFLAKFRPACETRWLVRGLIVCSGDVLKGSLAELSLVGFGCGIRSFARSLVKGGGFIIAKFIIIRSLVGCWLQLNSNYRFRQFSNGSLQLLWSDGQNDVGAISACSTHGSPSPSDTSLSLSTSLPSSSLSSSSLYASSVSSSLESWSSADPRAPLSCSRL